MLLLSAARWRNYLVRIFQNVQDITARVMEEETPVIILKVVGSRGPNLFSVAACRNGSGF